MHVPFKVSLTLHARRDGHGVDSVDRFSLQPKSDGLQPSSDGLHPKSDGLYLNILMICHKQESLTSVKV